MAQHPCAGARQGIHRRAAALRSDSGMSLVEVLVALTIFAVLATGLSAGAISIKRITADSRARQTATNLAARELDVARAYTDPTEVQNRTVVDSTTDPTHTYTITRTVSSVSAGGTDITCGSSVNFSFRRVSVTVDWGGRSGSTKKVRSDTILAPTLPSTDSGVGAISLRVLGADGLPRPGVGVVVTPVQDGKALTQQPDPTDADGCAYANRLVPGTYQVQLTKSGYVDLKQRSSWSDSTFAVAAGSTAGKVAQLDKATVYTTSYAKNFAGTAVLPTNLDTVFIPSTGSYPFATKTPAAATQALYPYPDGYSAVAGAFADPDTKQLTCAAMDPVQWLPGTVKAQGNNSDKTKFTTMLAGERASAVSSTTFGTSATQSIPMGVVKVSSLLGASYLTAVSVNSTDGGNPGCGASVKYTFPGVSLLGSTYVALPFGSWTIYQGSALGLLSTPVPATSLEVQTNEDGNGVVASGLLGLGGAVVTLDPRKAAP